MIDYRDFGARARASSLRCVALVRHGQRPAISVDDPTYGENLPLTAEGEALARACGRDLAAAGPGREVWAFVASRLLRTRLTAACAAEAFGAGAGDVAVSEEASLPGLWIVDQDATHRFYEAEGPVPYTDRLMRDGWAEGYRPVGESTRLAMEWVGRGFGARCAFVATHDVFLALLMNGLGVDRFRTDRWVGFLQGCALFERADGGWDAEFLVPDKSAPAARYVQ